MNEAFLKVLNMSIAASWLILAVMLLRFVLKRAPKWIAVALWGIVALRLAVPFSMESALSLIPSAETFSSYNIQYETPAISSGIPAINNAVNPVLGETFAPSPGSVNPLYVWTFAVSVIWLIGIAALLLYAVISYVRVRRSVAERVPYEGNIFLCDHVKSPFILGLIRPKIYLSSGMEPAAMEPVIAHEKAHLARHDHWWKPVGFLVLAVHWFNPLCWIAYVLLCRDIELACDEKAVRQMDLEGKKQYSTALLECNAQRRLVTICPLAFGEVGVKERVQNVLNYKKPAFWIIVLAVIACAAVTVCFATNPVTAEPGTPSAAIPVMQNAVREIGREELHTGVELSTDDAEAITEIIDHGTWIEAAPNCAMNCSIDLNGRLYYYHSDCGTFKEVDLSAKVPEENNKSLTLSDAQRDVVNAILEKYISLDPAVVSQENPPEIDAAGTMLFEEQAAIRQAILEHNRSANPINLVYCSSFAELACLSGTPLAGDSAHKITYYGWALYQEYQVTERGLETVGGSYTPVALSFDLDERGYTLTEYWEPRDDSYFVQDIREKFPSHIAEDGTDSRKFLLRQMQECYTQAAASTGLDTNKVIGTLIETICSSPAQSSNPEDYISTHSIEYRELIYYGQDTLKYCFGRFEKGEETGLDGHIMARTCEEIAAGWGEALILEVPAETGQEWYNEFKSNTLSLMEQYSEMELAERYPASYLLLGMLGEV